MADEESYGIMPYSEISDLKKQLKKMEDKDNLEPNQLMTSVSNLTKSIESMLLLFKDAAEEMKVEEEEEKALSKELKPLLDKVNEIMEQNKIIAEGMVALSDLVKEKLSNLTIEKNISIEKETEDGMRYISDQKFPRMLPPQRGQTAPSPFPPPGQFNNNFPPPGQMNSPFGQPMDTNLPPGMDLPPPPFQNDMPPPFQSNMPPPPIPERKKGFFGK